MISISTVSLLWASPSVYAVDVDLAVAMAESTDPVGVPGLNLRSLFIKLDFDDSGRDKIVARGIFKVLPSFAAAGATVDVDVGGESRTFILDDKGLAVAGDDSFRLKVTRRDLGNGTLIARWKLSMKRGDFTVSDVFDSPLDGSNPGIESRILRLTLAINGGSPDLRYNVGSVTYKSTNVLGNARNNHP